MAQEDPQLTMPVDIAATLTLGVLLLEQVSLENRITRGDTGLQARLDKCVERIDALRDKLEPEDQVRAERMKNDVGPDYKADAAMRPRRP